MYVGGGSGKWPAFDATRPADDTTIAINPFTASNRRFSGK
jgi:hypothetical protein